MVLHPVNIRFGNIIFTLAIRSSLYTYKSTTCHPKCQSTFIFNIVFSFYILFLRTVSIKGLLEMIKTVIITLMVLIIFSIIDLLSWQLDIKQIGSTITIKERVTQFTCIGFHIRQRVYW